MFFIIQKTHVTKPIKSITKLLPELTQTSQLDRFAQFLFYYIEKMMCGGQSELNKPDDESKQVLESVIAELREKTGHADDGLFLIK